MINKLLTNSNTNSIIFVLDDTNKLNT
jgi:hypothetical protein